MFNHFKQNSNAWQIIVFHCSIVITNKKYSKKSPRRYLHFDEGIFYRMRRLGYANYPASYANSSVVTCIASLVGQVKDEASDEERCLGPPG